MNVNQAYQNPYATPMFVTAVVVGTNTSYGVNSDPSTDPTFQIFNQTLAGGNGYCFFIVMPYSYFKFTGNISLGQVFFIISFLYCKYIKCVLLQQLQI